MTRLLKLVTVIFAIISLASAQVVDTLNTPLGPVTQGANVQVSWTLLAGVDATGKNGELSAVDSASKNTITIDSAVPLAPKVYTWSVKVPPGTYTLGLNDGSGLKQSGEVVVKAPAPGPGGSAVPAPGPGASPAPAPAPAPGTSKAPASGAGTTAANPPSTTGAAGGDGGSTSSGGGSSNPPAPISSPSSASLIFSGYEVLFSLLCVAIAMVQF